MLLLNSPVVLDCSKADRHFFQTGTAFLFCNFMTVIDSPNKGEDEQMGSHSNPCLPGHIHHAEKACHKYVSPCRHGGPVIPLYVCSDSPVISFCMINDYILYT